MTPSLANAHHAVQLLTGGLWRVDTCAEVLIVVWVDLIYPVPVVLTSCSMDAIREADLNA